jgi:regulatory protein
MDVKALYHKIANYCAYQERSLQDVEGKLKAWQVPDELHSQLLALLEQEGYLNQERFAHTYTRGKVYLKKWGKAKVKMYLRQKGVDEATIQESLAQVGEAEYLENAKKLALAKRHSLKDKDAPLVTKQKIYRYLVSKGFEGEVVQKALSYAMGTYQED